ncbi:hypothetical protein [Kitasatospora sp. CB01950]|uniref:hypothetical protein n=1 Tax=Kitasatospora sp. CB01950 TaxID=1703930 RepID=UPI00093E89A3|nr:hypothetical protein [Kitasatospora sp. CB01950]OKJ15753.1 hypothetical protein AMK19_05670 [Kitasatospora sp. CB01950]
MSTETESATALAELGRFFTIAGQRFDAGLPMPQMFSGAVDRAWHRLTEDPDEHAAFTVKYAHRRLRHAESGGEGFIDWVDAYEKACGPLPEIWFTDADGELDAEALGRYRTTGTVWAEWDCSPEPSDGDELTPVASYL